MPELVQSIKTDIDGIEIDVARKCDYCGDDIDTRSPVQCEVIRLGDMPNLRAVLLASPLPNPNGWETDSLRCRNCEIDTLPLETDGFDEALVTLNIADTAGRVTVETSELELIDVSKDGTGHHPPKFNLQVLIQSRDVGLVRWTRIKGLLDAQGDSDDDVPKIVKKIKDAVSKTKEVPPAVDQQLN